MELELQKKNISYSELVLEVTLEQEETLEMIVPDANPDILRIVDTYGAAIIRSKETQDGKAIINGNVKTSVIYVPEDDRGIKRMEMSLPFSRAVDNEKIKDSSKTVIKADVAAIETRIINPRKILVRANIFICVRIYNQSELDLGCDIKEQNEYGIQLLKKNYTSYMNVDIKDKTFTITDELEISSSKPPMSELLKSEISLLGQDMKIIGNKVVFKGAAIIKTLYLTPDDELCLTEHELPFSQIIELSGSYDDADCVIDMYIENFEIENMTDAGEDGRVIAMSAIITAQVCVSKEFEISLISDMYSTAYNMETEIKQYSLENVAGKMSKRQSMREIIETGMQATSVIDAYVRMGNVSMSVENDKLSMNSEAEIAILYAAEDNSLYSCTRRLSVPCQMDISEGSSCKAAALCPGEVFASPASGGIEVRFPVDFTVSASKTRHIAAVCGFKADFSAPKDLSGYPSVVLRSFGADESMWNIAKRYNTTAEEIMTANSLEEGMPPAVGQMLLIPKKR